MKQALSRNYQPLFSPAAAIRIPTRYHHNSHRKLFSAPYQQGRNVNQGEVQARVCFVSFSRGEPAAFTNGGRWENDSKRIAELSQRLYQKPRRSNKKLRHRIAIFVGCVALSLVIVVLSHVCSLVLSVVLLVSSLRLIGSPVLPTVTRLSEAAITYTDATMPIITVFAFYQPLEKPLRTYERLVGNIKAMSQVGRRFAQLVPTDIGKYFFKDYNQQSVVQTTSQLASEWQRAELVLSNVMADLNELQELSQLPVVKQIYQQLFSLQEVGSTIARLAKLYPFIAGSDDQKTYLLLLQNSMELRPTGGFIGSVGYLSFDNGKISLPEIEDVYTIDGQLRGHVDPPQPIQAILKQEHWYLRDSNWDPDFSAAAEQAAWFLEKSISKQVSGVIAINLPFVQELLRVTGPLHIDELNTDVSAETLFGILNQEVHNDFFPGSTKKKDLLRALSRQLLRVVIEQGEANPRELATAIHHGLLNHDLMIYTTDTQAKALLSDYGWDGRFLTDDPCRGQKDPCLPGFLSSIEANLAVNKVNFYVERSFTKTLKFTEFGVEGEDQLVIKNTAQTNAAAAGDYTNYTRLYYPLQTEISSVKLDNDVLPIRESSSSATIPYAETIDEQAAAVALGIGLGVPPQGESVVSIQYHQQYSAFPASYAVTITKQGGVPPYPASLKIIPPAGFIPQHKALVAKTGYFEYNTTVDHDQTVVISFITAP